MRSATSDHELTTRAGVEVLRWPDLDALGVRAVVTTRDGGVSTGPYESLNLGLHVGDDADAVVANRRRAAATIGLDLDDLVFCNQSHGRTVTRVTADDAGRGTRRPDDAVDATDALVTDEPGIGLVVMMADCVPILLVDPVTPVIAAVHAGWRGTVAGVVAATVDSMVAMGCQRRRIVAAIGPAIPAARYEVGDDVEAAARDAFGDRAGEVITRRAGGRWSFDLWRANRLVLADAGVHRDRVFDGQVPTGADGPFFSDRAQRPCGRFAALIRR